MHPSCGDIDAVADAVGELLRLGVFRVGDCQLAGEDEVRCQAGVGVWGVVCVTGWIVISLVGHSDLDA